MNEADKKLNLNRRLGKIGGVCAGLSDYFGVEVFWVRLAFVVATFLWLPTIAVYILLYFCLSDKPVAETASGLTDNRLCRHLKQVNYRKRLYKSRHNKKLAGVCGGLADYFETSAFWIRVAFVVSLFFGPFAVFAYIVAALVMDKEPEYYSRPQATEEPYEAPRPMGKRDVQQCSEKFENLEKKLRRLEATITSKRFKLHNELNRM